MSGVTSERVIGMQTMQVPEMQGMETMNGAYRYRVWDKWVCEYDDFPHYRNGGPSMVSINGWCVSYTTESGVDGVLLRLVQYDKGVEIARYEPRRFYCEDDARRVAFAVGAIAFMVYVNDESKWLACNDCGATPSESHSFGCSATWSDDDE